MFLDPLPQFTTIYDPLPQFVTIYDPLPQFVTIYLNMRPFTSIWDPLPTAHIHALAVYCYMCVVFIVVDVV